MAGIVTNSGKTKLLDATLAGETMILKAYQNDYVPLASSTAGNFTECTFSGYEDVDISATWGAATLDGSKAKAIATAVTFTIDDSGPQNVYGVYCVNGSGVLLWAERFAAMETLNVADAFITYTPKFTGNTVGG